MPKSPKESDNPAPTSPIKDSKGRRIQTSAELQAKPAIARFYNQYPNAFNYLIQIIDSVLKGAVSETIVLDERDPIYNDIAYLAGGPKHKQIIETTYGLRIYFDSKEHILIVARNEYILNEQKMKLGIK